MSKRKAWNDAMRSAGGTSALPAALQPRTQKRRSDRRKKQDRRDKARKTAVYGTESKELLSAAWMDALEDVLLSMGNNTETGVGDDDDSYDELDELDSKTKGNKRARGGRRKPTKKHHEWAGSLPKRLKPRSLANILLEEVSRDDGVAHAWLDDEARIAPYRSNTTNDIGTPQLSQIPAKKFCPVTGMEGTYTEPKSGLPYANLKALEQVRERPPPWLNLGGSIAYHEAVKSIRDEEDTIRCR